MSSIRQQAYLATRVSILRERLLPEPVLLGLVGRPLEQVLAEGVGGIRVDGKVDPAVLDRALMRAMLSEVAILLRPLHGYARDFFMYWSRRFELFNLKAMIRGKFRGLPEAEIKRHLLSMPPFTVLPQDRLLRAESVAELLRLIEAGPYGGLAGQARKVLEETRDTHAVEAAIDQRYYMGLAKRVHLLAREDVEATHRLMGLVIDRINLSWLVRYRFTYALSPTETYYYLIRHGHYLHRQRILSLVEMDSVEAVVEALPDTLREAVGQASTPLQVEQRLTALVEERARRAFRNSRSVVTRAVAYLILRESQLNSLRALILGTQLGLAPEVIRQAMMRQSADPALVDSA